MNPHPSIDDLDRCLVAAERGFTLLEMTVVITIFSMLVGLAVAIPEFFLTSKMIHDTEDEMLMIQAAVLNYYRDLEAFPTTINDLVAPASPPAGWMGPYLKPKFSDAGMTLDSYDYDEFHQSYLYEVVSTTVRRLTCLGENRTDDGGGGDDIVLEINAAPVLGEITRKELATLNGILATYNADFLFSNPLSTSMSSLLDQLQSANYLPSGSATKTKYRYDAWGQEYTTLNQSPVIEIYSVGAP
jgi:prepilin-type N-terminal cleavage/methylation domain-containing protein